MITLRKSNRPNSYTTARCVTFDLTREVVRSLILWLDRESIRDLDTLPEVLAVKWKWSGIKVEVEKNLSKQDRSAVEVE